MPLSSYNSASTGNKNYSNKRWKSRLTSQHNLVLSFWVSIINNPISLSLSANKSLTDHLVQLSGSAKPNLAAFLKKYRQGDRIEQDRPSVCCLKWWRLGWARDRCGYSFPVVGGCSVWTVASPPTRAAGIRLVNILRRMS